MKKAITLSLLLISILTFNACNLTKKTVRGDNNIVTKEISISNYKDIEINVPSEIHYVQDASQVSLLKVELDSNLYEHLKIEVENEILKLRVKDDKAISPSKLIITTNSSDLQGIAINGNAKILSDKKLTTNNFKITIAGSGEVTFPDLEAESTEVSISGSGKIKLAGISKNTSYRIAGSGNIDAIDLQQDTVQCKIAGSGEIKVNVKDELKCSIAGSGTIRYKGSPKISNSIAGSGKIEQID